MIREQTIPFRRGIRTFASLIGFLSSIPTDEEFQVTIGPIKKRRSDSQNAYLWGVVYATILEHLPGWDKDDIHEYCLGEWSGWEVIEGFGKRRMKPIRRSSKLTTLEFCDYVGHIQRTMAEKGIFIPDPDQTWWRNREEPAA